MRISNNLTPSFTFKGKVYVNYNKMASEIDKCPRQTRESLIGNVNTLKYRLETQTPDDKTFTLGFDYSNKKKSNYEPTVHYGKIELSDERDRYFSKQFELGCSYKTSDGQNCQFTTGGEEIWHNGFEEVTLRALTAALRPKVISPSDDKERSKQIRMQMEYRSLPMTDEVEQEIRSISDRIEDRAKVHMDKNEIATSIYSVTRFDNPTKIRESLIGNINTLSRRLEEETSKQKEYNLKITDIDSEPNQTTLFSVGLSKSQAFIRHGEQLDIDCHTIKSTHPNEYQRRTINIATKEHTNSYTCITDPETIYTKGFKPITDKLLWDGHHNLPNPTETFNKLT